MLLLPFFHKTEFDLAFVGGHGIYSVLWRATHDQAESPAGVTNRCRQVCAFKACRGRGVKRPEWDATEASHDESTLPFAL